MQIRPPVLPVPVLPENRVTPARAPASAGAGPNPDPQQAPLQTVPDSAAESRRATRAEAQSSRPTEEVSAGRRSNFERIVASDPDLPRSRQQALQVFNEVAGFSEGAEPQALVGIDVRV